MSSADDSSRPDEVEAICREFHMLASIETGLRGLRYWYDQLVTIPNDLENAARGFWHLEAFMHHADVLFTRDRASDPQLGAALRGLRDVGRPDLADVLNTALRTPATETGRSLASVIARTRNSLTHRSYDIGDHGADFQFWGLQPNPTGHIAVLHLVEAADQVADVIVERKESLIAYLWLRGRLDDLFSYVKAGPERARDNALRARRARRSTQAQN
jgi:hypothetical protein